LKAKDIKLFLLLHKM